MVEEWGQRSFGKLNKFRSTMVEEWGQRSFLNKFRSTGVKLTQTKI